eukprot:CAMPEP_0114603142 /NCGR_PEP_ID=MMETSP0125-20121206/25591_1 /TAXON_ID=485358 ORGANISM="Aristerostoma sp., Strain ATCC 50986" /NCGR_SAMPLE_ID=MMETSP0125 /ASSEMBLY_ACC=CAM_ASM_000245 /LENGTH=111 /DNA_ID=CAMNT_0001813735 /DNA_START=346 /DNA_END=681 /DNA_ORIENTATION=-
MLQDLHKKMKNEYELLNKELETVKNANLKEATEHLTQNLEAALQDKLASNNFDVSALKSPIADAILEVKRSYMGPSSYEKPTYGNSGSDFHHQAILPSIPKNVSSLPHTDP